MEEEQADNTMAGSSSSSSRSSLPVADVCTALRHEFENMRRALSCSICLSTFTNPVTLSGCAHAYCRDCIRAAMVQKKECPLCGVACGRRSMQEAADTLEPLVQAYKLATRRFGLAPQKHVPTMAMTQLLPGEDDTGDSAQDKDAVMAAETFRTVLLNAGAANGATPPPRALLEEQEQIVQVNKACAAEQAAMASTAAAAEGKQKEHEPSYSQILSSAQEQETANYKSTSEEEEDNEEEDNEEEDVFEDSKQSQASMAHASSQGSTKTNAFLSAYSQEESSKPMSQCATAAAVANSTAATGVVAAASTGVAAAVTVKEREVDDDALLSQESTTTPHDFPTTEHDCSPIQPQLSQDHDDNDQKTTTTKTTRTVRAMVQQLERKKQPAAAIVPAALTETAPAAPAPCVRSYAAVAATTQPQQLGVVAVGGMNEQSNAAAPRPKLDVLSSSSSHFRSAKAAATPATITASTNKRSSSRARKWAGRRHQSDLPDVNGGAPAVEEEPEIDGGGGGEEDDDDDHHDVEDAMDEELAEPTTTVPLEPNDAPHGDSEALDDDDDDETMEHNNESAWVDDDKNVDSMDTDTENGDSKPAAREPCAVNDTTTVMDTGENEKGESPSNELVVPAIAAARNLSVDTSVVNDETVLITPTAVNLVVGTVVDIQPRTWPGVNQPGGVAKITKVYTETDGSKLYDVLYVLDRRKEKKVDAVFVSLQQEIDSASKDDAEGARSSRSSSSRRSPAEDTHELSPALREQLKKEGCDVDGAATARALAKINSNPSATNVKKEKPGVPFQQDRSLSGRKERIAKKTKAVQQKQTNKRKSNDTAQPVKRRKAPIAKPALPAKLPNWTDGVKCKKADELYRKRIQAAITKGVLYLCTSFLSELEEKALKVLCRVVKGSKVRVSVSDTIQPNKTTVVILPAGIPAACNLTSERRSMKAMQASIQGIPIVAPSWVDLCIQKKKIVIPEASMYVRTLPTKTECCATSADFGVAFLAAATGFSQNYSSSYRIFQNIYVYMIGFSAKVGPTFSHLLRDAGVNEVICSSQTAIAKVKTLANDPDSKFVILCNDSNVTISEALDREVRNHQMQVVLANQQWLFDSISCGRALDPSVPYKPHGVKAKELWELTKSVTLE